MAGKPKNELLYPHVLDMKDWPILLLSEDRAGFVKEIAEFTIQRIMETSSHNIRDVLSKTVYLERIRIKEHLWKVDPPDENQFWKKIRLALADIPHNDPVEKHLDAYRELVSQIVHRYADEVVGNFKPSTYSFARKFLTAFFSRLLNTAAGRNLNRIWGSQYQLQERIRSYGEIEKVRSLVTKGTVVLVPTHFSNLDSILIGYACDSIGLPAFYYGAGLNLFNEGIVAYYMNRLGAYRVDRRKRNALYLETLKAVSNLSIQRGVHSLFFPGGTRSRSGKIETQLKLGLLSTTIEAQRSNYMQGRDDKIFIVPVVLGYHFVLEAKTLIEQYLRKTGREQYIRSKDEFYSFRKLTKFSWKFFSESSEVVLSFGKPMDVLGNFVDDQGVSYDRWNRPLNLKEYFVSGGEVVADLQRENEYTKHLVEAVVSRFHRDNIVLSSHVVAFAAFHLILKDNARFNLYGLLRLPPEDFVISRELFLSLMEEIRGVLIRMEQEGKLKLSEQVHMDAESMVNHGLKHLGVYHVNKPLKLNRQKNIVSQDLRLLFYYSNHLENYGLADQISWKRYLKAVTDEEREE